MQKEQSRQTVRCLFLLPAVGECSSEHGRPGQLPEHILAPEGAVPGQLCQLHPPPHTWPFPTQRWYLQKAILLFHSPRIILSSEDVCPKCYQWLSLTLSLGCVSSGQGHDLLFVKSAGTEQHKQHQLLTVPEFKNFLLG